MMYGAFVWAGGALNSQKRRFRARAGVKAIAANAGVADNANCPERGIFQFDGPDGPMGDSGMMGWTVVSLSQKSKFGGVGLLPNLAAWDYRLQSDADSDSALSHLSVQLFHLSLLQRDKYVQLSTAV